MDRKNKKASQLEAREREPREGKEGRDGREPTAERRPSHSTSETVAAPVPIRSALSSSLQSASAQRSGSSPMRDPIGPPPPNMAGTSPGFARSPVPPSAFASSPSRPSPLSASFGTRGGAFSLRASAHSPLRPPSTAFAASFSHTTIREIRPGTSPAAPLSASFADGSKNIWARNETPHDQPEILSPRRPIQALARPSTEDVFAGDDDENDYGEDLIPSSLSELLTPKEQARRMSRRDSSDSFSLSPNNAYFRTNGERLAQSAGARMGPGFLHGLWSSSGVDARKEPIGNGPLAGAAPIGAIGAPGPSLLAQQRVPNGATPGSGGLSGYSVTAASANGGSANPVIGFVARSPPDTGAYLGRQVDPSSPSSRALQAHAPGQSLPGGLANALSRLHLHGPRTSSGLASTSPGSGSEVESKGMSITLSSSPSYPGISGSGSGSDGPKKEEQEHEEGLFDLE